MCKAQGAEGQGAKHLQKARQFLEHRLHAAVIKLEEEQHKQAIAHDDEQAKGALVDKEGPDHSGCDSGQSRKRRKTALSLDYNPCILKAEAAGGQPRCMARIWDPKGSVDLQCGTPARKGTHKSLTLAGDLRVAKFRGAKFSRANKIKTTTQTPRSFHPVKCFRKKTRRSKTERRDRASEKDTFH